MIFDHLSPVITPVGTGHYSVLNSIPTELNKSNNDKSATATLIARYCLQTNQLPIHAGVWNTKGPQIHLQGQETEITCCYGK